MLGLVSLTLLGATFAFHWSLPQVLAEEATNRFQGSLEREPGQDVSDLEMSMLASYLDSLLREPPWSDQDSPLVYIEEPQAPQQALEEDQAMTTLQLLSGRDVKRSRYYRRYPWKRQNTRHREDSRYICNPTKEDVFQLLIALHEAQGGNSQRTVNFCNRKRPASAVFTNIRFLGRRRK